MNKFFRIYLQALVPAAGVLFFITATLKLTGPLAMKLGLIDRALAHEVPEPMLYAAAAIEFAAVFLLTRSWLAQERKLQLLFLLSSAFISFRVIAFGSLFAPNCGCFGPLSLFTEQIGHGLEMVLVIFLSLSFLGYPLQVLRESLAGTLSCESEA